LKTLVRSEQKNATVSERTIRSLEYTCMTFFEKMLALELRVNVLSAQVKDLVPQVVTDLTAESESDEFPDSPIDLGPGLPTGLVTLSEADFAVSNKVVEGLMKEWVDVDTTD